MSRREQLLADDTLPAAVMEALEENGVLVFPELHIDDETQIEFSKRLDDVGKDEPAPAPSIYNVTLDPAKTATAPYLLGTFYWHIDGAQDEVPTKATMLSARVISVAGWGDRVRQHVRGLRRPARRREGALRGTARPAHLRSVAAPGAPRPLARGACARGASGPTASTPSSGNTAPDAVPSSSAPARTTSSGMDRDEGKALLADLVARGHGPRARLPARVDGGGPRHLGQHGRDAQGAALRSVLGPRDAPHHHERRRADPFDPTGGPMSDTTVLRAERWLDVEAGEVRSPAVIVVDGNQIVARRSVAVRAPESRPRRSTWATSRSCPA